MNAVGSVVVGALLAGALAVAGPAGPVAAVPLVARGSVHQVMVEGATAGAVLELRQAGGDPIAVGQADANGTFIFGIAPGTGDDVPRGSGYTVTEVGAATVPVAEPDWGPADAPAEVLGPDDHPPGPFYAAQTMPTPANPTDLVSTDDDGYGYLTTRDGTTLSVNVLAPYNFLASPPYPTIVVYSGYEPSAPDVQGDPDDALTTLLRVAGYAVVAVNIRGTGCSGGAYSYFEPLQGLDGYDVVETVAAQPWVAAAAPSPSFDPDGGPKIGMAGISFGGISQLFVARTNPPSLAAITPLSVIADTYRSTLYPGGIYNDGFAEGWAAGREQSALPSGQPWAAERITALDDEVCGQNQRFKLQAPPLLDRFEQDLLYEPDPGDDLSPATFVDEIEVPTFIAGSFQDEQTGGHWSTLLDDVDTAAEEAAGTDELQRAVLYNGTHADALGPDVLRDLLEFLDLYVHRLPPRSLPVLRGDVASAMRSVFGAPYAMAPNRAGVVPNQRAYEAEDDIVVRWERGARDSTACRVDGDPSILVEAPVACVPAGQGDGAPFGRFETTHSSWPPPGVVADEWFLHPDGGLAETAPSLPDDVARGWSSFRYETDPGRTQTVTDLTGGGGIWNKDATYLWEAGPEGDRLRFVGPELVTDRLYAGRGSVTLWLRSTAADVDLEATLTEVRPDGQETLVQSGWLRASNRAEATGSTALEPAHTHLAHEPLPPGAFVPVRVELFPFAHVVRAGSRIALTVSAPGGNRPLWTFDSPDDDDATVNDIAHSAGRASVLVLPEVTADVAPTPSLPAPLPVCGDLRSQPCRATPESHRATAVTAVADPGTGTDRDRGVDVDWSAPEAAGVTAYEVGALPSGVVTADADLDPGLRLAVPLGALPPGGDPTYTVGAAYGPGAGLVSNASLGLLGPHPFGDVPGAAGWAAALDWAWTWRVVAPAAGFRGGDAVTRGQFVRWLWNAHGRPTGAPAHGFTDVRSGARIGPALSWARAEGIVNVFPGNRFGAALPLARSHAVRWLWVTAARPTGAPDHGFTDVPAAAPYGTALDWAVAEGIVAPGSRFRPAAPTLRRVAIPWLHRTAAT